MSCHCSLSLSCLAFVINKCHSMSYVMKLNVMSCYVMSYNFVDKPTHRVG